MSLLTIGALQQDLAAVGTALRQVTAVVRTGAGRRGRAPGGQGSGIVWSADGTIVTNAHVATGGDATVELPDGRTVDARLVARDARRDLALLRIDLPSTPDAPLPAATIGDPSALRPGAIVVALGHPLGVPHALAVGVAHAGGAGAPRLIRADIRLAPGNSGGPLADAGGRVLGVNSMIVGGLGVAVSVDEVRRFLAAQSPRPALGATLRSVAVRVADAAPTTGLLVLETTGRGAAERAGIAPGDVLLGHAGRPFASADDLLDLLGDAGPGASLRLDVGRGGRRITCVVELGEARARAA
ncbi:MAG: trypsin-like peptidase domain-containing protein [Gemmatirosa sp.]|nr:trypsin-like peptidase domain-containing protein [Gemmatirosa sp.]